MELSSQYQGVTINVDDNVVNAIAEEVTKQVASRIINLLKNVTDEDAIRDLARSVVRQHMSGRPSTKNNAATTTSVSDDATPSSVTQKSVDSVPTAESVFPFDLKTVVSYIMDSVHLVQIGESCDEVSDIMHADVLKATNSLVDIYLKQTKLGLFVNMHNVPQVVALHKSRWPGFVKPSNVEHELYMAFFAEANTAEPAVLRSAEVNEEDSNTPLSGKHLVRNRPSGYSQGTYKRVKRGSNQIRCRCHRNSDQLAPMVIDPEIGEFLYNNGFTHVRLTHPTKNNGEVIYEDRLNLVFTKEAVPTRAPRLSTTISRLHPYGNGKEGKVSTYCLGSDTFNRSILNHFNQSCKGLEERVFEIRRTGPEKDGKIGFEITSVTA